MLALLQKIMDDLLWPAVFVVFFWVLFFANEVYQWNLHMYGVHPRSIEGLVGIVAMPFLHGDFSHLFSNTIPFIVSATFLFHFFERKGWTIFFLIWLISGLGIWVVGAERSVHIGASGLVYGLVAFLMTSGFIRRNKNLMALAFILVFLYGSMVWGLFPQYSWFHEMNISWEGHLFGAIAGVALAIIYRKEGPSDDKDPFENEDDEQLPDWWVAMENERKAQEERQKTVVRYIIRPRKEDKPSDGQ